MNKSPFLPYLFAIVLSFFCSCTDDGPCNPQPQSEDGIQSFDANPSNVDKDRPIGYYDFEGEWYWVRTTSGWGPDLTPESIGHKLALHFDHDTYTFLADGGISHQYQYELKTEVNHFGSTIEYILLDSRIRYNIKFDSISLELSENLYDGSTWKYVRK